MNKQETQYNGLTPEQLAAVTSTEKVVFVSAGAGTGKTRVLVDRFVHLLETQQADAGQIAALTFTEKAAAEMKGRIRARCLEKAQAASGTPHEAFWRRQHVALESARIGTIHAFCAGLLRSHPVEATVDPQFTQLEEAQALILRARVAQEILEQWLESGASEARERAIQTVARLGSRAILEFLVRGLGRRGPLASACALYDQSEAEVLACWRSAAEEQILCEVRDLRGSASFLAACEEVQTLRSNDPSDKAEIARSALVPLLQTFEGAGDVLEACNTAAAGREVLSRAGAVGSRKNWDGDFLARVRSAMVSIRESFKEIEKSGFLLDASNDPAAYRIGRGLAHLASLACDQYDGIKQAMGVLDFEDLLLKARRLTTDTKQVVVAFRRSTLHLMVDEFQDTDPVQRDIIFALTEIQQTGDSAFRKASDSAGVFFVGDGKQSIYRFRGADVSVFTRTERLVGVDEKPIRLKTNFRSTGSLLAFVNGFFEPLMAPMAGASLSAYETRYAPLHPLPNDPSAPEADVPAAALHILAIEDDLCVEDRRRHEAARIAEEIQKLVEGSGVECREIAMLFRRTGSSYLYEEALDNAGIPYQVESGRGFYRRQEVRDVTNVLKVLNNRLDDLSLVGVLRSPMVALSDESIFWLAYERGGRALWEQMQEPAALANLSDAEQAKLVTARDCLAALVQQRHRLSVAELIHRVLDATGFEAVLATRRMGQQMVLNVRKLFDTARAFDAGGVFTLADFVRYLTLYTEQNPYEPQAVAATDQDNAVRIMTVHGSKGREFPVVIIPDCSFEARHGQTDAIGLHPEFGFGSKLEIDGVDCSTTARYLIQREEAARDLAESKRLLYVAMTRAERRLIISSQTQRSGPEKNSWLAWILEQNHVVALEALESDQIKHCSVTKIQILAGSSLPAPSAQRETAELQAVRQGVLGGERVAEPKAGDEEIEAIDPEPIAAMIEPVRSTTKAHHSFRATELGDYQTCPAYYHFARVLQLPHDAQPPSDGRARVSGPVLGTLVHEVLEKWSFDDLAQAQQLARQGIDQRPELADARDLYLEQIMACLKRLQSMPACEMIRTAANVRREVPFLLNAGGRLIEGVMDALVELPDGGLHVIDYKTDAVKPDGVESHSAAYRWQIQIYQLAAAELLGTGSVAATLAYLTPGVCVNFPQIGPEATAVRERLGALVEGIANGDFHRVEGAKRPCRFQAICAGTPCS